MFDRSAEEVLPQLLALGAKGRAVWVAYAILPLTLVAAAVGASDVLNGFLGNAIGEFVGELALYSSFAAFALALWRLDGRKMAVLGVATATLGLLGMFRNITPMVQPAADVTNVLLPVFLIAFGIAVMRQRSSRSPSRRKRHGEDGPS